MPHYLLESNRNVAKDLETGELYGRRIGPYLAGDEAAISQDLPFGHSSLLRTDSQVPDANSSSVEVRRLGEHSEDKARGLCECIIAESLIERP
jgi:hypothetical protein